MNLAEDSSTREYRDRLSRTLEIAKTRLSTSDFRAFAHGIEKEVSRLNEKLLAHPSEVLSFEHHLPDSWARLSWVPVSVQITSMMIAPENVSVRFNSPVAAAPWTSQIKDYEGFYQIQASKMPLRTCASSCGS